jgi:hypothetical protein
MLFSDKFEDRCQNFHKIIKKIKKLKTIRIIDDNKKDKLERKHIVNVTFHKKGYYKGNIVLPLSIINPLPKYLELVHILGFLVFFNY